MKRLSFFLLIALLIGCRAETRVLPQTDGPGAVRAAQAQRTDSPAPMDTPAPTRSPSELSEAFERVLRECEAAPIRSDGAVPKGTGVRARGPALAPAETAGASSNAIRTRAAEEGEVETDAASGTMPAPTAEEDAAEAASFDPLAPWNEARVRAHAAWCGKQRAALLAIERDALTERERLAYDGVLRWLKRGIEAERYCGFWPAIEPDGGTLHALLDALDRMPVESEAQAEAYLKRLSELPDRLDELAAYERMRDRRGFGMTDRAIGAVQSELKSLQRAKGKARIESFERAVGALKLSKREQTALSERCRALWRQAASAFGALAKALEPLKSGKTAATLAKGRDARWGEFYAWALKGVCADERTAEAIEQTLLLQANASLSAYAQASGGRKASVRTERAAFSALWEERGVEGVLDAIESADAAGVHARADEPPKGGERTAQSAFLPLWENACLEEGRKREAERLWLAAGLGEAGDEAAFHYERFSDALAAYCAVAVNRTGGADEAALKETLAKQFGIAPSVSESLYRRGIERPFAAVERAYGYARLREICRTMQAQGDGKSEAALFCRISAIGPLPFDLLEAALLSERQ